MAQLPQRPPPPENTVASGISRAILWYTLAAACGAIAVNFCVVGSHSSGVNCAVSSENGTGVDWPPTMKTEDEMISFILRQL